MKKENKRMAQEKRAAERKKQATMQLVRNAIIVAIIVAFFVGMIVYGVIDSRKEVKDGDTVNIDYSGSIDGFVFQGGTAQNQNLTIGSHSFIDDFEEQLIGHKIGETVEVNVTFPENYGRSYTDDKGENKSFNGAEAVFTVKINGIYER